MTQPRDCVPLLERHILYGMARWASSRPVRHGWKGRTCRDLWDAAPRGDWLLHYAGAAGADRRDLVRAAAACVRPALRFVPAGEDRPRLAIEAAERWADMPTRDAHMRVARARMAARVDAPPPPLHVLNAWLSAIDAALTAEQTAGWGSEAALHSALAHLQAEGPESGAAAHLACADEVRRLVPFLDLHDR